MKHKMTLKEADKYWDAMSPPEFKEGDSILIVPEQKIIDFSMVAGTRIPILFGGVATNIAGYLKRINTNEYQSNDNMPWKNCAFDTSPDAWVSWGKHVKGYDGKCPLPEGVEYEVLFDGFSRIHTKPHIKCWNYNEKGYNHIKAFRVTGLADGGKYAWEVRK